MQAELLEHTVSPVKRAVGNLYELEDPYFPAMALRCGLNARSASPKAWPCSCPAVASVDDDEPAALALGLVVGFLAGGLDGMVS
jgi:hypothetical protein